MISYNAHQAGEIHGLSARLLNHVYKGLGDDLTVACHGCYSYRHKQFDISTPA